ASATHLVGLVDEILTFSRLEADVETVRAEPTMLQHLVEDAVTLVEPMIVGKGLTLHVDVPDAPVTLTTDPAKVRQILVNLLGNATKFTDAGSIALRASCEPRAGGGSDREAATGDSVVIVEVEDTGVGIAPEHLDHIFEPFTQVHHGRTRAVGGTGLGLAVSRQLATLLGGALTVSSEVGRGSVFRLTLPVLAPRGATMVDVLRGGSARLTKPATAPA